MELNKNNTSGEKKYPNGNIYNGEMINDLHEGKGIMIRKKT